MLLKDICPSFSCPSCKKLLNFFDLRTFVAKFCRDNLRTFSADFFRSEKQNLQTFIFFLDVCLYVFARQLFLYRRYKKVLLFRFGLVLYPSNSSHPLPAPTEPYSNLKLLSLHRRTMSSQMHYTGMMITSGLFGENCLLRLLLLWGR